MDSISKERRSILMGRIKSNDTSPELYVRSLLHRAGYRFRLHVKNLPGKPDIVLAKYKTVVEIRGCFWHLHKNCTQARIPQTRSTWWADKLERNVKRDQINLDILNNQGWRVIVVWCCIFKKIPPLVKPHFSEFFIKALTAAIKDAKKNFIEIDRSYLFHDILPTEGVPWNK